MFIDTAFASGYEVELLEELPGYTPRNMFYVPPTGDGGRDGVLVRVRSGGAEWIGCFAFGDFGVPTCALVASPQQDTMFVVAAGAGYAIDVNRPSHWSELPCLPIRQVGVSIEHKIVWFGDFIRLMAYGAEGLMWRSRRLCWDGLQIIAVEGNSIIGRGDEPTNPSKPTGNFAINLLTGEVLKSDFDYAYTQSIF